MATTKTQVPSIPAIPKNEREAEAFNNSIKEILEVRLGRRGDPKDRAVTLRELIDSGLATELLDNPFDPNAGAGVTDFASSSTFVDGKLDDTNDLTAPPTPTGLAASAGTTKIILNWNFAQISNLAHTEVWRSSDNNLSNAVRHDTTEAFVWVDSVDPGDEFYYWIRHVTTAGIFSQFAGSVNATTVLIAGTKIAADAITETKIADDAITTPKILTNAVTSNSIASATITAGNIGANELTSASGILGTLDASEMTITNINASNITTGSLSGGKITASSLDVAGKSITDSIGRISGVSGENSTDNSQNIEITELFRTVYGQNNFPKHIVGGTSTSHDPAVSIGDVMGGSPRFQHAFTTYAFSGNRDFIIQVGIDFTGSSSSASESIFAVAMRATTSASNFTSTNASDYIFTDKIGSAGSHSLGIHMLSEKVQLAANTTHYIWCFALGDDGVSSYKSGFINVFGLNK